MCGIFATLNHNSDSDCVTKTVKSLNNRGPEKSSFRFFEDKYLAFGFNRLAINGYKEDSSDQPISLKDCTLICNGEIYNWKELHGVINTDNTTGSDCEIIIHMYKLYGIEYTLTILDGVYAFILYDHSIQKIYVARDAFGIRPLFYSKQKDTLIFSSEMKQIEEYTKDKPHHNIQFYPGTFSEYKWVSNGYWYGGGGYWNLNYNQEFFNTNISVNKTIKNDNMACRLIKSSL